MIFIDKKWVLLVKKIKEVLTIVVSQVILATVIKLFLVTTCTSDVTVRLLALPKAGRKMVQLVVSAAVPSTTADTNSAIARATTVVLLLLLLVVVSRDHCSRGVLVVVLVVQVTRRRL